jgi:hypothetical protein
VHRWRSPPAAAVLITQRCGGRCSFPVPRGCWLHTGDRALPGMVPRRTNLLTHRSLGRTPKPCTMPGQGGQDQRRPKRPRGIQATLRRSPTWTPRCCPVFGQGARRYVRQATHEGTTHLYRSVQRGHQDVALCLVKKLG